MHGIISSMHSAMVMAIWQRSTCARYRCSSAVRMSAAGSVASTRRSAKPSVAFTSDAYTTTTEHAMMRHPYVVANEIESRRQSGLHASSPCTASVYSRSSSAFGSRSTAASDIFRTWPNSPCIPSTNSRRDRLAGQRGRSVADMDCS